MCQPGNSRDLNVLDLGVFNAIQALQHKEAPHTIDGLFGVVVKAFKEFPTSKCNKVFLTLQSCMVEIMKAKGCNNYKIPRIKKELCKKERYIVGSTKM